ncbi:MAG: lamin tail domain-containing protein, partial [Lysobacterales bacterium]
MQHLLHRFLTHHFPGFTALKHHVPLLGVLMLLLLFANPVAAQLVINEVDYDQAGTDTAEFLEIKNTGGSSVNLSTYTIELVSGGSAYNTIPLPAVSLAAGDYFVVCANAATVANCDLDESPDTNFIQNGAPDAIGLKDGSSLVDALSYEGDSAP